MTSKDITTALGKYLFELNHSPICPNFQTHFMQECDMITVAGKAQLLHEYEIKVTVSDFKADFKKPKHTLMKKRLAGKVRKDGNFDFYICSYFSYVCPAALIRLDMIPEYAGLIWVHPDGRVDIKKVAPCLHEKTIDARFLKRITHRLTQLVLFGASYVTHQMNERKERIEARQEAQAARAAIVAAKPVTPPKRASKDVSETHVGMKITEPIRVTTGPAAKLPVVPAPTGRRLISGKGPAPSTKPKSKPKKK